MPTRKVTKRLYDVLSHGRIDIFSPACPDYSYGADGKPDLKTINTGPGRNNGPILDTAPGFISFFLNRHIPVRYSLILADIEAEDDFRCRKMTLPKADFLSRIYTSEGALKTELQDRLAAAGLANHRLLQAGVFTMRRDGFYTDADEKTAQVAVEALPQTVIDHNSRVRRGLYEKYLTQISPFKEPERFSQARAEISRRYIVEYSTFGLNIARRNGIVFSTDDLEMAQFYKVPCFALPKPGGHFNEESDG